MLTPQQLQQLNQALTKKTIASIKEAQIAQEKQWYFVGVILTYPQTMVIEQQIRQAIFVFEEQKPQELMVVVLSEPAVRKYCNILRPFSKIEIVNGERKFSYLNSVYVLITAHSSIHLLHSPNNPQMAQEKPVSKQRSVKENDLEESKKYLSLNISNLAKDYSPSCSSSEQQSIQVTKSQKIEVKRQGPLQQLISFCGTVVSFYEVGRGKTNHGLGYRIEKCFSGAKSEVVVWSDMGCGPLRKGQKYQFKQFRLHRKRSIETSYHSHPQYSSIIPMP